MKAKLSKKRTVCVAIAEMLGQPEPPSGREGDQLANPTNPADAPDFPEGREDPEQSAELERQQDA